MDTIAWIIVFFSKTSRQVTIDGDHEINKVSQVTMLPRSHRVSCRMYIRARMATKEISIESRLRHAPYGKTVSGIIGSISSPFATPNYHIFVRRIWKVCVGRYIETRETNCYTHSSNQSTDFYSSKCNYIGIAMCDIISHRKISLLFVSYSPSLACYSWSSSSCASL